MVYLFTSSGCSCKFILFDGNTRQIKWIFRHYDKQLWWKFRIKPLLLKSATVTQKIIDRILNFWRWSPFLSFVVLFFLYVFFFRISYYVFELIFAQKLVNETCVLNCVKNILRVPMNSGIILGFSVLLLIVPMYFFIFSIKKISEKPFRIYAKIDAAILFGLGVFIAYKIVTIGYLHESVNYAQLVKQVLTGEISTTEAQVQLFH